MVPDWPGVGSINPAEPGPSLSGQGQSQDASGSVFLFWAHPRAGPFSNIAPPRVGGGVGGSTPACGKEVATWLLVLVRTKEDKRVRQPSSREKSVPPASESLLQGTCPRTQVRCVLTPTVYIIQALPPPKIPGYPHHPSWSPPPEETLLSLFHYPITDGLKRNASEHHFL